jgi:hypothetical protein
MSSPSRIEGVFDRLQFPEQLTAHVVDVVAEDAGGERRVAGYAVESDLAVHAGFLATAFLALKGELPTAPELEAFSTALTLLSPASVNESAGHATVIARVAAAPDEVLGGVAATALGQMTKAELGDSAALWAYVDGVGPAPAAFVVDEAAAMARYLALASRSASWFSTPLPHAPALSRVASAYALLAKLGFRTGLELQAVSLLARLPALFGEARHIVMGAVTQYPTRTPDHHYVEGDRS